MKHIFVVGARGYHAKYGGWETFLSNLVDNYNDNNVIFHVSSLAIDESEKEYQVNNVIVTPFSIKNKKSAAMLLCTIKAFNYYLNYIKENKIENAYIYILGLKLANKLKIDKKKIQKLKITTIVNPDGLEHERAKWNKLIKKFFLYSERSMLNNCDIIICDAKGIKNYIDNKYPKLKNKTKYIAYGAKKVNIENIDENKILKKYDLEKDNYLLMVGRFVPENNYEMVIKAFLNSKINKKLIIVSNISSSNYYNELVEKLKIKDNKNIVFIDGIYNQEQLAVIRKNAYLYIHGHSVGGTNPSLLEALSLTKLNILYDVCFNKDVGKDACLYFNNEEALTNILDNTTKYDRIKLGKMCKEIINNNFTWEIIIEKYKQIFK